MLNGTITNVTSHQLQNSLPNTDYVGYVLGIIAIAIAVYSYYRQKEWNNKIELLTGKIADLTDNINKYVNQQKKIEDSVKLTHLLTLSNYANMARWQLNSMVNQLEPIQLVNFKQLIEQNGETLINYSDNVLKHCTSLNFRLMADLYQEIESVGNRIRKLSSLNQMKTTQIIDVQKEWISYAKETIGVIGHATEKIYEELGMPLT